jgi:UDP-glucose:(heptosyl)LPS alpha-1,3-glucosyltransferase
MKIALAIVSLFPSGGLQRDCMAVAAQLIARGHEVTIFAERRRGEIPPGLSVELLPNRAWSNHRRDLAFADAVVQRCRGRFDRLVGFGKLIGLDVLYCADPCIAARPARWPSSWMPRRKIQLLLEAASFETGQRTLCLMLSENQARSFRDAWSTEPERLEILPPTIDLGRRHPELRTDGTRDRMRDGLRVAASETLWLAVAGQPKVKGLDRAVAALKGFAHARLAIAGIAADSKQGKTVTRWARSAGVADRLHLLGVRSDVPELMAAADLLVHPARYDTTGTVILEALVNGLSVVTTSECGYASHVTVADAGVVIPAPFSSQALAAAIEHTASASERARWSANGIAYGLAEDLYRGLGRAADIIAGSRGLTDDPPRSEAG